MKTSYKLALAVCALIFTGSVVYWAKKKFSKAETAPIADVSAPASDLSAPATPPPAAFSDNGAAITVAPDAGAAALAAPPPATDLVAAPPAPPAPAAPAAPVGPVAAEPAPASATPVPPIVEPVKTEVPKPVAKTEPKHVTPKTTTASRKTYAVRSGDTLTSISQKFFGDKNHTDKIYKANRKLIGSNPNALKVGMKLEIPAK